MDIATTHIAATISTVQAMYIGQTGYPPLWQYRHVSLCFFVFGTPVGHADTHLPSSIIIPRNQLNRNYLLGHRILGIHFHSHVKCIRRQRANIQHTGIAAPQIQTIRCMVPCTKYKNYL